MRLLLAEDEKELSDALTVILRHNNYSVDAVYNGLDALDYLMNQDYDGVILDIMMPGMDGIEVLKRIRSQGNVTPVLILTAKSEIDERVVGLDSGADDYLCKPFSTKELLARIRAVSEKEAGKYAKKVFEADKKKGFMDIYRFRKSATGDGIKIIFLDCRMELEAARMLFIISLLVFMLGLLAVFVLVLVFSKMVFAPVHESYVRQRQFITNASHEIKTPLAVISANTEVLEMEMGENQWTISTHNQIDRLNALTSGLLTLARLDEENCIRTNVRFSLSQAVSETVSSFLAPARLAGKTLDTDIRDNVYMSGDEKQIRQMINILIDNAVKYSDADSTIAISLYRKGGRIIFKTLNDVAGIDKGNHDIIFERFYRRDESRNSNMGGFGIGLSAAKSITNAHKGKIQATSKDGKSLGIIVTLPAASC